MEAIPATARFRTGSKVSDRQEGHMARNRKIVSAPAAAPAATAPAAFTLEVVAPNAVDAAFDKAFGYSAEVANAAAALETLRNGDDEKVDVGAMVRMCDTLAAIGASGTNNTEWEGQIKAAWKRVRKVELAGPQVSEFVIMCEAGHRGFYADLRNAATVWRTDFAKTKDKDAETPRLYDLIKRGVRARFLHVNPPKNKKGEITIKEGKFVMADAAITPATIGAMVAAKPPTAAKTTKTEIVLPNVEGMPFWRGAVAQLELMKTASNGLLDFTAQIAVIKAKYASEFGAPATPPAPTAAATINANAGAPATATTAPVDQDDFMAKIGAMMDSKIAALKA